MYTFLVLLTNKSSELDIFLIKARLLFITHRGKKKKSIENVQFTSL